MRGVSIAALLAVAPLGYGSCAPRQPEPFSSQRARAERHYTHGRYSDSARAWKRAANETTRPKDRLEALYRAGAAHQRAGNLAAASETYRRLLALAPGGARAPRAAYELALIEIAEGRHAQGEQRLRGVMIRHQESAMAGRAFDRLLRRFEHREGRAFALRFVDDTLGKIRQPELLEQLRYARATLLAEQGQQEQARLEYLRVADEFPYPKGALWDDALWHAADLERRQGRPERALDHLRRMLREVESAHFQGSYARSRYAEAQFRIAEIYRDDLHQEREARLAFRKVFNEHPTSLLRDDALWQEALLARAAANQEAACDAAEELVQALPESRFVPCAPLICARLRAEASQRPCRRYIRRSLEADAREASAHADDAHQSSK